jgi:phosphohistidine phosphatase SixA
MRLTVACFFVGLIQLAGLPQMALAQSQNSDPEIPSNNSADFSVKPATRAVLNQLRDGGYVIYLRDGYTDTTHPDRLPKIDLNNCASQRPLTAAGRELAAKVGKKIRRAKIPLGEIYVSPPCRMQDTASAAFASKLNVVNALLLSAAMSAKEKMAPVEATRELLSRPQEGNSNRVIVSHAETLMELMGYLPQEACTVVIFKPLGDKHYKYIATIDPQQWNTLKPM